VHAHRVAKLGIIIIDIIAGTRGVDLGVPLARIPHSPHGGLCRGGGAFGGEVQGPEPEGDACFADDGFCGGGLEEPVHGGEAGGDEGEAGFEQAPVELDGYGFWETYGRLRD
jgi:hypothetical protein